LLIGAYLVFIFVFDGGSPRKVETFVIKSGSVDLVLAVVGRVKSKQLVNIRPEQPGSITKMMHDEGDIVEQGDVLAQIKSEEERVGLKADRAQLEALDAEVELAKIKLNRAETLAKTGYLAKAALNEAQASVTTAEANKRAAQAIIEQVETRLGEFDIRAPMAGTILSRPIDPGQIVAATDTIFQIGSVSSIELEAEVDEYYADNLQVGMRAILSPSGSEKIYKGKIYKIAPSVDPLTGGRLIYILPDNDAEPLLPGRSVDINVITQHYDKILSLPRSSLEKVDNFWQVYVVENGEVLIRKVTFIDWPGASVVINSGLNDGDHIILNPMDVKPGEKVEVSDSIEGDKV
jgi:RND family efflux transporter MFP subunit